MSSHSSCSQLRMPGGMPGPQPLSRFILESQSDLIGSSEIQPFGLNSTVDPSRCRHLKQKFTGPTSEQIACADAENSRMAAGAPTETPRCLKSGHPPSLKQKIYNFHSRL